MKFLRYSLWSQWESSLFLTGCIKVIDTEMAQNGLQISKTEESLKTSDIYKRKIIGKLEIFPKLTNEEHNFSIFISSFSR